MSSTALLSTNSSLSCTRVGLSTNLPDGVTAMLQLSDSVSTLLVGNPKHSYFSYSFRSYMQFALGDIKVQFGSGSPVGFGANMQARIPNAGHMLRAIILQMVLPGLQACPVVAGECGGGVSSEFPVEIAPNAACSVTDQAAFERAGGEDKFYTELYAPRVPPLDAASEGGDIVEDVYAYYAPIAGWVIPQEVHLEVNGTTVASTFTEHFFVNEEILGRPGTELMEQVGRFNDFEELIEASRNDMVLMVPLPFWFSESSHTAFPMAAANASDFELHVQTRPASDVIVRSSPSVDVKLSSVRGGGPVTSTSLQAAAICFYAFLTPSEVAALNSTTKQYIFYHTERIQTTITMEAQTVSLKTQTALLDFCLMVRRQCNTDANMWFDFSGIDGLDPIAKMAITVGGHVVQHPRCGQYYNKVQPFVAQAKIPCAHLYYYSFSLYPRFPVGDPSGCAALNRLYDAQCEVLTQRGLADARAEIIVVARRYSYMSFSAGSIVPGTR